MNNPLLLSIPDAAKACGVGRDLFYDLVKRGSVPSVYIGRRRLIRTDELAKWTKTLPRDAA
jgi:excisionase family DNA binding protein